MSHSIAGLSPATGCLLERSTSSTLERLKPLLLGESPLEDRRVGRTPEIKWPSKAFLLILLHTPPSSTQVAQSQIPGPDSVLVLTCISHLAEQRG